MVPLIVSTAIIAAAELGDKSQLLALAFATRYRAPVVIAGITAATLLVHLFSVAIGRILGAALPMDLIQVIAGVSFIAYGVWTIRGDHLEDGPPSRARYGAFLAVAVAFFLAELGDKTQLATVSLATQYEAAAQVWIGSTMGMVIADSVAIGAGVLLDRRLPEGALKWVTSALFFAFGAATIITGLR